MQEVILLIAMTVTSALASDLQVDDKVVVVNVQRFGGHLPMCVERQVCADVFNFTRDHGDGTGHRESRILENCQCMNNQQCGRTGSPLLFRETKTQSMMTCEDADMFRVCEEGEIAKVQHNIDGFVFYQINCVCPNNEFPGTFRNKMTIRKSFRKMTYEEQAEVEENPRSRFFRCREMDEYRPPSSIFN